MGAGKAAPAFLQQQRRGQVCTDASAVRLPSGDPLSCHLTVTTVPFGRGEFGSALQRQQNAYVKVLPLRLR